MTLPTPEKSSPTPCTSTPSTSTAPPSTPTESCAVCGASVHSRQYGVPNCLGCIVFFRRSVLNKNQYKCWKNGKCVIDFASRCACRACRLRKCFHVGMDARAIQQRDRLGPRNPRPISTSQNMPQTTSSRKSSGSRKNDPSTSASFLEPLLHLQQDQHRLHETYSNPPISDQKNLRLATSQDINFVFKLGIKNADEWANQFDSYRTMSRADKNLILAEYGFSFSLVDQYFKTSRMEGEGIWVFQNGTVLESGEDSEELTKMGNSESHYEFVKELTESLAKPFRMLEIDDVECVILKTMLLFTPTFPNQVTLHPVEELRTQLLSELMEHSTNKYPEKSSERYGEIILLTSSIRCAVKSLYNQTRKPGIFHLTNFEPCLRSILLS